QLFHLAVDFDGALENIAELQKIGLIGDDLLQAERPLLIPRARQPERLVPGRKLDGAGAGFFGEHHGEHFEEDTIDVIFRLLFGEAKRVDLNAVAEAAELLFPDAVTIAQDFIPKVDEGAHLAHFSDEANPRIDEETDPSRGFRKVLR